MALHGSCLFLACCKGALPLWARPPSLGAGFRSLRHMHGSLQEQGFGLGFGVEGLGFKGISDTWPAGRPPQVKRGRRVLHEGKVVSLRRVKEDVREVSAGMECGILIDGGFAQYKVHTVQTKMCCRAHRHLLHPVHSVS